MYVSRKTFGIAVVVTMWTCSGAHHRSFFFFCGNLIAEVQMGMCGAGRLHITCVEPLFTRLAKLWFYLLVWRFANQNISAAVVLLMMSLFSRVQSHQDIEPRDEIMGLSLGC